VRIERQAPRLAVGHVDIDQRVALAATSSARFAVGGCRRLASIEDVFVDRRRSSLSR
jgi:hypothetical protein